HRRPLGRAEQQVHLESLPAAEGKQFQAVLRRSFRMSEPPRNHRATVVTTPGSERTRDDPDSCAFGQQKIRVVASTLRARRGRSSTASKLLALLVLIASAPIALAGFSGTPITLKINGGWSWFQDPRAIIDN